MRKMLLKIFMVSKKSPTFSESINMALKEAMTRDKSMICYGLGINDPKEIFNTTKDLCRLFGNKRVFDIPTSENALTGVGVGAAISGIRTVMTHQRLDFSLLSMDQIINSAAKWRYMFGGKVSVPLTIRMIIGRGWGQGPTHSQNLSSIFCNIPGLKVVMPTFSKDAKRLLISSIFDPNPVIFLEHRWLHQIRDNDFINELPNKMIYSNVVKKGDDLTIVAMSYLTLEAIKASEILKKNNINSEIIDLVSLKPLNLNNILKSVRKTKRLLVLDTGFPYGSIASEITSLVTRKLFKILKFPPQIMTMPDIPEPTSFNLTKNLYIDHRKILKKISKMFNKKIIINNKNQKKFHDIPGEWFKGPF